MKPVLDEKQSHLTFRNRDGKLSHAHMGQAPSSFLLISASPGQSFSIRASVQLNLIEKLVLLVNL